MKKIYVLLALVIFSASCEKEEILEIHEESSKHISTVAQKDAIDFLKNVKKSNPNKQAELIIHYDQIKYDTINNSTELLTVIPAQTKYTEVNSRVLVLEVNGNIEPVLFNLVPDPQSNDTLFTGKIIISDLDLEFINGYRVKNGNFITQFVKTENTNKSTKCDDDEWAGIDMGCNQTLDEVILESSSPTKTPYVSISAIYPEGSASGYDGGTSWSYPEGGGGGTIDPIEPLNSEPIIITSIDDINLDTCLKDLLNKINGHYHGIGKIIALFADSNSNYNWNVSSGNANGSTGQTSTTYDTSNNIAYTTFDSQSFPKATDLSWVRTILHESAHAYVVSIARMKYLTAQERNDLLGENWLIAYNNQGHPFVAATYINSIADILEEFGRYEGYTMDSQFYKDLAWGGLTDMSKLDSNGNQMYDIYGNKLYEETPWFKAMIPNASDRKRIKDLIAVEVSGKDTAGNIITQGGTNANC